MRIVSLDEFLAMPDNTLFSKYEPSVFEELQIKRENCGEIDFFASDITDAIECTDTAEMHELLDASVEKGTSIPMDFTGTCRDGCYEKDQLFAVWEHKDLAALTIQLDICMMSCLGRPNTNPSAS